MSGLGKLWAGQVYDTNTGNLFIEFEEIEPRLIGTLRYLDTLAGVSVYEVEGTFDGRLNLTAQWKQGGDPEAHGELSIEGQLTPEGNLRGVWRSTIGTGGTFLLFPHDITGPVASIDSGKSPPEQLYSRNVSVGAVRLYAQDVLDLLRHVEADFSAPHPVITYQLGGSEVSKYSTDFMAEVATLGRLENLKITAQEPDAHGINRVVVVELSSIANNEIRAQGIQESWVVGKTEALAAFLRRHQSGLVTSYRKFGLNINSLIFLAMLVLMPDIASLEDRSGFVVATFALLGLLYWIHRKFIPNASIVLTEKRPNAFIRAWPAIFSWFATASASLVAALVFYWLTRNTQ